MAVKNLKDRIVICALLAGAPAFFIALRLFWLQTVSHEVLAGKAEKAFSRTVSEVGPRGRIYSSGGDLLAESIPTWDALLYKKDVTRELKDKAAQEQALESTLTALQKGFGLPPDFRSKFRKAKDLVPVKKGLDRAQYEAAVALNIRALQLVPRQTRYYPSGDLARNVIGLVGPEKGLSGAEILYDKVLSGKVSKREIIRDAAGRVIFQEKLDQDSKPRDLYLTLDRDIQFFSQEAVKEMVEKSGAELGMALVQEPASGRLLALATWPEDMTKIQPVEWVYEPGSTMKSVTLAAALDKGIVSEKDTFYCENGAWKFNSKVTLHDHEPEKTLTLSQVIERSSNIGTAKIGLKLGVKDLYLYLKSFGFGTKGGLGFPGESAGLLRALEAFKPVDLAVGSFGHGIGATPVQVITAYSAIANGGELFEPRLVDRVTEHDGKEVFRNEPGLVRRVVQPETSARVKKILRSVVTDGTGKPAAIPGYSIAGKTGTANKIDPRTGKYITGRNVTSFAGFFPLEKPQYTILVVMDNPRRMKYGGESSAPVFKEIASRIITLRGMKPDVPVEEDLHKGPAAQD